MDISHHQIKIRYQGCVTSSCLIELLAKGYHGYGNPQTTQALAKTIDCTAHTEGKALLLKTIQVAEGGGGLELSW